MILPTPWKPYSNVGVLVFHCNTHCHSALIRTFQISVPNQVKRGSSAVFFASMFWERHHLPCQMGTKIQQNAVRLARAQSMRIVALKAEQELKAGTICRVSLTDFSDYGI